MAVLIRIRQRVRFARRLDVFQHWLKFAGLVTIRSMNSGTHAPGHPPHDRIVGVKVGAVAGAVGGAAIALLLSAPTIILPVVGSVVGGVIGYRSAARA